VTGVKETFKTNFNILKNSDLTLKIISAADVAMQVLGSWPLYLTYTATRCCVLAYRYATASTQGRIQIWKEAQVYASMKVLGLVIGQIALLALGLTPVSAAALILGWGVVLASMSCYAHYRAKAMESDVKVSSPLHLRLT
jgi:hypothetical protein